MKTSFIQIGLLSSLFSISPLALAEITNSSSAPMDMLSEQTPIAAPALDTKKNKQDEISSTENLKDEEVELKTSNGSMLKTILPFTSFCGTKLTVIPPNTQLVIEFAQKAAIETFTYDYKDKKDQWFELEKCYTKLGWKSFESAVSRSGNNQSVYDEKLFVSAKIDGKPELLAENEIAPSWKIMIPLKVKYENQTHYLEQTLKVKLVVSIEKEALGVDQIIASPSQEKHKYEVDIENIKKSNS